MPLAARGLEIEQTRKAKDVSAELDVAILELADDLRATGTMDEATYRNITMQLGYRGGIASPADQRGDPAAKGLADKKRAAGLPQAVEIFNCAW